MSCDLECPLMLGVTGSGDAGPTSRDSLIHESQHMRVWLDAKGRPMLVVTPKRHCERLADLGDRELVDLWRTAIDQLTSLGITHFNSMVLNHGNSRNHAHLHLKIRPRARDFEQAVKRHMSDAKRQQLEWIRNFAAAHLGRCPKSNYNEQRSRKILRRE